MNRPWGVIYSYVRAHRDAPAQFMRAHYSLIRVSFVSFVWPRKIVPTKGIKEVKITAAKAMIIARLMIFFVFLFFILSISPF